MQLIHDVSRETFDDYIGGTITLADRNGKPSLIRGELRGMLMSADGLVYVRLTRAEYASGRLDEADTATWYLAAGIETFASLRATVERHGDRLVFPEASPRGSTAILARPANTSTQLAA